MQKFFGILALICLLILPACSLFEPRDSFEDPDGQKGADVLGFANILKCPQSELDAGIKFVDYRITELFANEFVYTDVNEGASHSKQLFINRLNQIGNPQSVVWTDAGNCTRRGDTIFVRESRYEMTFSNGTKAAGQSNFNIVKQEIYRIVKWTNYPADGTLLSYLTPIEE
jgi:hypothetical protein